MDRLEMESYHFGGFIVKTERIGNRKSSIWRIFRQNWTDRKYHFWRIFRQKIPVDWLTLLHEGDAGE